MGVMNLKLKRAILGVAAVAALGLGVAAIAGATGGGGDDGGGTGDDAVALKHTGGGRVNDTEFQDEEGY